MTFVASAELTDASGWVASMQGAEYERSQPDREPDMEESCYMMFLPKLSLLQHVLTQPAVNAESLNPSTPKPTALVSKSPSPKYAANERFRSSGRKTRALIITNAISYFRLLSAVILILT